MDKKHSLEKMSSQINIVASAEEEVRLSRKRTVYEVDDEVASKRRRSNHLDMELSDDDADSPSIEIVEAPLSPSPPNVSLACHHDNVLYIRDIVTDFFNMFMKHFYDHLQVAHCTLHVNTFYAVNISVLSLLWYLHVLVQKCIWGLHRNDKTPLLVFSCHELRSLH